MRSVTPPTPYGYTVFCDDVRHEVGNKLSYIGIYPDKIVVHAPFPAKLAKFAFAVLYIEGQEESTEPVTLKIWLPGDPEDAPFFSHPVPIEELRNRPGSLPDELLYAHMIVAPAPLILREAGLIKVRAYRADLEIKLGTMRVDTSLTADTAPAQAAKTDKPATSDTVP